MPAPYYTKGMHLRRKEAFEAGYKKPCRTTPHPNAVAPRFFEQRSLHWVYALEGRRQEKDVDSTAADRPEENTATQKAKKKPEHAPAEYSADKFAEARRAKKKEKRKRHRARLRRPHTDG